MLIFKDSVLIFAGIQGETVKQFNRDKYNMHFVDKRAAGSLIICFAQLESVKYNSVWFKKKFTFTMLQQFKLTNQLETLDR